MADQYNKTHKLCATPAQSAMVGMVIGGRAARACDVCGKERARCYCAADMAYLCQRCDGAVHSANAVASRHERVRLGSNGMPMKMTNVPAVYVKRDASPAVAAHPSVHFNPRKRPRSIRRHKPSSLHASKHAISSSIHASSNNHIAHTSDCNGSILACTHGVMIDNPRRNPDFIANIVSNELFSKAIHVKAEPYSPVDIGDQLKVPDHIDDDHLLESLFDFRGLQDDDLFLHQVPIYNPLHNQDLSPSLHSAQCGEEQEQEEKKPNINITPSADSSRNDCANAHSPELSQAEGSKDLSLEQSVEDQDAPSLAIGNDGEQLINSNNDICYLDQLDFDCVLQAHGEDSDDMNHASMDMDISSDDYNIDPVYPCDATTEESRFAEVSYDHHGNCNNLDDADGQSEQHAGYVTEFDFDAMESESPRSWLCKVKEESPQLELGSMQGQHGDLYDDKLACKGFSTGSTANFKLGLKLNFEDVLSSWSDRDTFWMDGCRPSQVGSCLDFLGGCFVPDIMSGTPTEREGPQLVPALNHKNKTSDGGAREASVLRYREKRRTRLFSKKIRYEVRKLNAEKRPRMKGRFIKRITI